MTIRRVLLIKSGIESSRSRGITPPLGLMYIASFINVHHEYEITILDTRLYKNFRESIEKVLSAFDPDIVGISALTLEAPRMFEIAHIIKSMNAKIPVVVGGPHATSAPEEVISNSIIDIAVAGEGERSFAEILEAFSGTRTLDSIDGIYFNNKNALLALSGESGQLSSPEMALEQSNYKNMSGVHVQSLSNKIIKTRERAYIENLDMLPYPDWDAIELGQYAKRNSMSPVGIRPYMALLTSRGCPYRCTYCHNIFGKQFRARSVGNILNEMEMLINHYHIKDFEIIDDISNLNRARIQSLCRAIIAKDWRIRLSFPNGVRTDILDEETIVLLKRAGTAHMAIAVETASPRLQKLVKKNLNLEKVKQAIDIASRNRIFMTGFFMIGFPTETEEELKSTIDFACRSKLHLALFFVLHPFKGTEIVKQIEHSGKQLPQVNLENFDYYVLSFNPSIVDDKRFHWLYTRAYLRFYLNPFRLFRILRDKPLYNDLLGFVPGFLRMSIPASKNIKSV